MGATAAIIAAIASAAATGYGAYSTSQAQKKAAAGANASIKIPGADKFQGAYGDVPRAAMFDSVDIDAETIKGLLANRENLPLIKQLLQQSNNVVTKDALARATKLIPGYRDSMNAYGTSTNSLLKGQLPFDDVLDIVSNRSGLNASLGTPGTGGNATLRDLGIGRLDAIKTGGGMLADMVSIAEKVSPRASYSVPRDFLISPMDRVQYQLVQNQLIQNSEQNRLNAEAAGDPSERARLEAQLGILGQTHAGAAIDPLGAALASAGPQLASSIGQWYTGRGSEAWRYGQDTAPSLTATGGVPANTGSWKASAGRGLG